LEVSPVYFRGRIFPVSVMHRLNMCGLVKGISAGVRLRGFGCSGVVMAEKSKERVRLRRTRSLSTRIFPAPAMNQAGNSTAKNGCRPVGGGGTEAGAEF
jgi:hypothetical protein